MMITWGDLGVCLGCVVRVESTRHDSTMSLWTCLARGCNLGIPYERYLWWVHVRWVDLGEDCLRGTNPWDSGVVVVGGVGYPL